MVNSISISAPSKGGFDRTPRNPPGYGSEKVDSELGSTLNTPEKALDHAECDFFPNIHTLLCIMGTLPVTSCECECSISMLTEEHNGTGTS